MSPGMQGSVPGAQIIRRVYPKGGHEWPPFLFVMSLTPAPALLGTEMTEQLLFLSAIKLDEVHQTILNDIARRDLKRSGFRQERHA